MVYERKIRLGIHTEPVYVEYVRKNYKKVVNTGIQLYGDYKLSVLFTDGMAAVKEQQICNTIRGDVVVFRPEETHFARILREGEHRYLTILIPRALLTTVGGEELAYIFEDTAEDRINHISPQPEQRAEILHIGEKITALLESEAPAAELRLFAYIVELLALCRELYDVQKRHPLASTTPAVISAAIRYIAAHYHEIDSLSEIAAEVGCSITYLTRLFRQYTGKTVWGYLTECRIVHAKRMLESGMSVTETCYRAGFGDCSHFIKSFRRAEGVTPLQYRIRHGG